MPSRRLQRNKIPVLVALAVVVVVTASVIDRGSSRDGATIAPSLRPAIAAFSTSYLAYLEGQSSASQLRNATAQVQRVAAQDRIPAAERSGSIRLTAITSHSTGSAAAQAAVAGRDGRHHFGFVILLDHSRGSWQVVSLQPPDLAMVFAPRYRQPATPAAVQRAAISFAHAYIGYREGVTSAPPSGLPPILAQIRSGKDPLAGIRADHARATVTSAAAGPPAGNEIGVAVTAGAGGENLSFSMFMEDVDGVWRPWEFVTSGDGMIRLRSVA